jgi:PD-(D/E)XK nuclease superfamily
VSWETPLSEDERFLMEAFEANFERLREESGRSLAPFVKEAARQQVLLYYRRLHALAAHVEETEVRLVLPEQTSPAGRQYTLEGVVDIVEDGESTVMYDLKTYLDAEAARDHVEPHYRQLNVYAHIWRGLRGRQLDKVAVIATRPTRPLYRALRAGEVTRIQAELKAWNPVLEVPVDGNVVAEVMESFGCVVDLIEDRKFNPPGIDVLQAPSRPQGKTAFAQDVCLNCDARFGCASYRQLVRAQSPGRAEQALRDASADFGGDAEKQDWRDSGVTATARIDVEDEETSA